MWACTRLVVNISSLGYPKSLHTLVLVFLYVNDTAGNASYIYDLIRRTMETPLDRNMGIATNPIKMRTIWPSWSPSSQVPWWSSSWSLSLFWCAVAMHHDSKQLKEQARCRMDVPKPGEQTKQEKEKEEKKISQELSFELCYHREESKPDDAVHEPINGTISLPAELEEQKHRKIWLGPSTSTTFKPNSPDLAKHYKSKLLTACFPS